VTDVYVFVEMVSAKPGRRLFHRDGRGNEMEMGFMASTARSRVELGVELWIKFWKKVRRKDSVQRRYINSSHHVK
jgi:hypothetical protein